MKLKKTQFGLPKIKIKVLNINVLVLAARIDEKGPGPIISELTTKEYARLRIPIMIVPGNFSKEHIALIN